MLYSIFTSDFAKNLFSDTARHGITALGMFLIAHGILANSQFNDFLGSGCFLATVIWQIVENLSQSTEKKTMVAQIAAAAPSAAR